MPGFNLAHPYIEQAGEILRTYPSCRLLDFARELGRSPGFLDFGKESAFLSVLIEPAVDKPNNKPNDLPLSSIVESFVPEEKKALEIWKEGKSIPEGMRRTVIEKYRKIHLGSMIADHGADEAIYNSLVLAPGRATLHLEDHLFGIKTMEMNAKEFDDYVSGYLFTLRTVCYCSGRKFTKFIKMPSIPLS